MRRNAARGAGRALHVDRQHGIPARRLDVADHGRGGRAAHDNNAADGAFRSNLTQRVC